MSLEPFHKDDYTIAVMKSFVYREELTYAIEVVQQTGILQFYSQGQKFPFDVSHNPYKWSKL